VTHLFAEPCIAITGAEEAKLFFDPNCCIRKNANGTHTTFMLAFSVPLSRMLTNITSWGMRSAALDQVLLRT
jgi:hypothetical protein